MATKKLYTSDTQSLRISGEILKYLKVDVVLGLRQRIKDSYNG